MTGTAKDTLPELLRLKDPDLPRIIDRFIARFNAAYGDPAKTRWDISTEDWQRYEFLGDRVLNLIVAQVLFTRRHCVLSEGEMTKVLGSVVSNQSLASIARAGDPGGFARLVPAGIGDRNAYRDRVIGGAFEAFIGALYCEAGFDDVAWFITGILSEALDRYDPHENAIGWLQEYYQQQGPDLPEYTVVSRTGPDHRPSFTVRVTTPDDLTADGTGPSLPEARQAAAREVRRKILEKRA